MKKAEVKITDKDIEKALTTLGIGAEKTFVEDELKKGEEDEEDETAAEEEGAAEDENADENAEESAEGTSEEAAAAVEDEEEGAEDDDVTKAEELESELAIIKAKIEKKKKTTPKVELEKADDGELITQITKNVGKIIKAQMKPLEEKFDASSLLIKAQREDIASLTTELEEVQTQLEEVSKASPGRRSVTAKKFLEKGFEGDELEKAGIKVLSLSKNKQAILNHLEVRCGLKAGTVTDEELSKGIPSLETGNYLPRNIIERLKAEDKIVITA